MNTIRSFAPLIDKNSTLLILGSIPGVQSLKKSQYYGNPCNQFWKIIFAIYEAPFETEYAKRIEFLNAHNIALWDVIAACERDGSLDTSIRGAVPNDFDELFTHYPKISRIAFNGKKAHEIFSKKIGLDQTGMQWHCMPSTSPAHTLAYAEKLDKWKTVIQNGNG